MSEPFFIIFSGPPGPKSPSFIEVENAEGCSLTRGEWIDRGDGTWALGPFVEPLRTVTMEDIAELTAMADRESASLETYYPSSSGMDLELVRRVADALALSVEESAPRTWKEYRERDLRMVECPTCREAGNTTKSQGLVTLRTDDAASKEQIPNGIRWLGVRCEVCGDSFTVDAVDEIRAAGHF